MKCRKCGKPLAPLARRDVCRDCRRNKPKPAPKLCEDCGVEISQRSVTGLCARCRKKRDSVPCSECGARANKRTGLCPRHREKQRAEARKVPCAVCGKLIKPGGDSGLCLGCYGKQPDHPGKRDRVVPKKPKVGK